MSHEPAASPPSPPAQLSELEAYKRALDEHAIVAITDARGSICYVNDKFCAISKWSREELIGSDHRIINSGHHPKAFIRELWETISSGRVWKGELKNLAKDGSIYWVETTIVPFLGADGSPAQYVAIRAEITARKLLEQHNEEMLLELQAANRELNDFAYIVSHDLKAPLRGISSLASWLMSDYADKLGAEGAQQLGLIDNRVKRLGALVDGILAYSRAGRGREERRLVNLDALVRNSIELLAPPPHLMIELNGTLPSVQIDPFKAQQLFQNLLSNAIKYMDKAAGRVTVSCAVIGPMWQFTVADNGPGIEARFFDKIFQLFQTLSPRDKVESTGVGLALVKKIVELEGGRVWVESTPGEGAAFHFTLPAEIV
ncbi:ATP-binding protein [Roseateles albus]|uniref:histidine kinase n=1 Tax=Roseateles albus TaxID=2987525 RepID=A0ABT5KGX4_9BURK|nr:ATP-binding protein [Roseateles albus]MDC8773110.1 ATP-binding protein [Roseateles albus]